VTDEVEAEALLRLALTLYRESVARGIDFYSIDELVNERISKSTMKTIFDRLFRSDKTFWSQQEDLAKRLASHNLAEYHSKAANTQDSFLKDHFVKITPFAKALFDVAHADARGEIGNLEGITIEDIYSATKSENQCGAIASDLRILVDSVSQMEFSNFEQASIRSYLNILIIVCESPEPDRHLFWTILNRLNQFSGIASLVVALIALRAGTQ
jgi:hypothetical protein